MGCAEPSGGKRNWNKEHGDECEELVTQRDLGWVRASGGGRGNELEPRRLWGAKMFEEVSRISRWSYCFRSVLPPECKEELLAYYAFGCWLAKLRFELSNLG